MNLVFCDVETTGLDEKKDPILELALVAVSLPRFELVAKLDRVIVPALWPTVKRNLHEKVRAMHEASGLMREVDDMHRDGHGAVHLAEGDAVAFVREYAPHTPAWHTPLAGANPDFDRRFLRVRMPKLHACFHYRNFDVRSITQLQDWVFGATHRDSPHRTLADCMKAIQDVRDFLGVEQ